MTNILPCRSTMERLNKIQIDAYRYIDKMYTSTGKKKKKKRRVDCVNFADTGYKIEARHIYGARVQ